MICASGSNSIRRLLACLMSACLVLLAPPAGAQDANDAPDEVTVILDWFVNPNHAPIVLAQELGYFDEAGLAVEVVAPADPSDPPKMVAAGRADLAISYQPQLHLQVAEGLPLIRVGTLIAMPLNCLLVRRDGDVAAIADLEGGRVGFSVAGVEEALLAAILSQAGLGLDDVTLVNVNFSLAPALMSGQVDAVIGAYRNFELTQMAIEGVPGRCFNLEEHGLPTYDELIYVANPERMDRDVVRRFLLATERAVQFIVNRPDAAWERVAATEPELRDELNARAWEKTWARFSLTPMAVDHARYAAMERFLSEAGLVEGRRGTARLAMDPGAP